MTPAPGMIATQANDILDIAVAYTRRGWRVLPIPYRSKKITSRGWQQWRLDEEELPEHFTGRSNIGVLLGEPSGWLIDIDLDHPRAVELADEYLPATDAIFGRSSKPRSHWLYIATAPVATKKHRSKSAGMIVELRSTGAQTVFPPSVHESGEPITWNQDDPQPTEIDPDELLEAVKKLAHAVKVELGEKATSRPKRSARQQPAAAGDSAAAQPSAKQPPELPHVDSRYESALNAMLAMRMVDHGDGSSRLFAAACRCVEHDLSDEQAVECIRQYARQRPFPRTWPTDAIVKRLRDAEERVERGAAYQIDEEGLVPLGRRDPRSGRLVLSPRRTLPTAEAYVREFHVHPERPTIITYADLVMNWQDNRYVAIEDAAVKHQLQPWLHEARRYIKLEDFELVPFESNPGTVKAALESIQQLTHLDATVIASVRPAYCGRRERRARAGRTDHGAVPDPQVPKGTQAVPRAATCDRSRSIHRCCSSEG